MAVTYDRVDLSQINFNLLRHDYTDGHYPGYPIIADWGTDPRAHVDAQVKSSLFKTMAASGLNQMNLYDTNNNVIGEITIQYKLEYVTYERVGGFGDEQTSTSGYPEYRNQGHGGDWGVKYIRVSRADIPTYDTVVTVTINGVTETRHFGQWGAIEVADYYGTLDEAWAKSIVCGSDGGATLTLMSKTTGGTTHYYLEWSMLSGIAYTTPEIDYGFEYTPRDTDLLADNLSFTEHVIEEDGYVNELMNRFSPRYWSNMTGIYVIPESTMSDLSEGLVQQNLADWLNRAFFGSDGKQYIMAFRWYYGLLDSIQKTADLHNINFGVGKVTLGALGETPVQAKVATREFAVWQTSEMSVMPHFDNYLDMLSTYELYLPYYGFLNIDPNDIVGGTIQVFYNINLVTGTANINVVCKTARTGNLKTKSYTLNAQVGIEIPFGADMLKEMTTAWAQTCGKAFATGASIGLGMSGQGFGDIVGQAEGAMNAIASNPDITEDERAMALNNAKSVQDSARNAQSVVSVAQHAMNTMSNTTPALSPVVRSGGTSNESGSLDELFPYLLITRPMAVGPSNYEEYVGMPSYASANLGSISGFTKVAAIKPSSMTNAPKYLDEIIAQLKAGVYL